MTRQQHNNSQTWEHYIVDTLPDNCAECGEERLLWQTYNPKTCADGRVRLFKSAVCGDCIINARGWREKAGL